jgi:type IV secretion system protein VirB9
MRRLAALSLLLLSPFAVHAADVPRPGLVDPRIQTIDYDPNQVVLLRGTTGYQFMLEFAPGERIETVSIGDSLAWQVTPNRRSDVLFVKPIASSGDTNLTVLTDQRRYAFELRVEPPHPGAPILYIARMVYPQSVQAMPVQAPPPPEAPPVKANTAYGVTGSAALRPIEIFDDGQMTYFQWAPNVAVPAIFAVAADGSDSLVNYVVRGPYIIVDQVAGRFKLRSGKEVATVEYRQPEVPKLGMNNR